MEMGGYTRTSNSGGGDDGGDDGGTGAGAGAAQEGTREELMAERALASLAGTQGFEISHLDLHSNLFNQYSILRLNIFHEIF